MTDLPAGSDDEDAALQTAIFMSTQATPENPPAIAQRQSDEGTPEDQDGDLARAPILASVLYECMHS